MRPFSGNALIDIKVTKKDTIDASHIRQGVSYVILARGARKEGMTSPEMRSIGVYKSCISFRDTTADAPGAPAPDWIMQQVESGKPHHHYYFSS